MLTEEIYNLDKKENSPVIVLPWFHNCRVLIDTGSTMPMWLKSIVPLKIKGAVKQDRRLALNGVGGKTSGDLYKLNFDFGNILTHCTQRNKSCRRLYDTSRNLI